MENLIDISTYILCTPLNSTITIVISSPALKLNKDFKISILAHWKNEYRLLQYSFFLMTLSTSLITERTNTDRCNTIFSMWLLGRSLITDKTETSSAPWMESNSQQYNIFCYCTNTNFWPNNTYPFQKFEQKFTQFWTFLPSLWSKVTQSIN